MVDIIPATKERFAEGNKVGDIARYNHPGGVFIDTRIEAEALSLTANARERHLAIFEAAFLVEDVLIRADLLLPNREGYRLVEVKSSTEVKQYHIDDAAVQTWAMTKSGCEPNQVAVAYINNQFVYQGDGNYFDLFTEGDLSNEVKERLPDVEGWVHDAKKILALSSAPNIAPGTQCKEPFLCDFYNYCNPPEEEALYPVDILPYGRKKADELRAKGYKDLRNVPSELLEDPRHIKVHTASVSGVSSLEPEATRQINELPYPRYYLDFETVAFAVPIWKGTRPYMQIPFQWSCHIENQDGTIAHHEFLDISGNDPRLEFAETLVSALGNGGVVIVYSAGFEGARLKELAEEFPLLSNYLLAIKERFFDLLPLARNYYYHPDMKGSWSIKHVLPTIAPELNYSKLEVSDGTVAQEAYKEVMNLTTSIERREHLRKEMLKYCKQDTWAMVKIVEAWRK
ncbi:DUF2779 domain-containing protein [Polynucleobacter sp. AP-Capit-er-40B-B4]|uniref:DUF2779 domain-containing protein n=1 Tax=Polynucleobacter sp. AP-Capit-er-40B-B4 TaxID=2576927 RepID=UPI00210244B4|nr:DUF2779 domain-containing protein [Polynucleobacter sp. AP-Capit-er-40B-B4]